MLTSRLYRGILSAVLLGNVEALSSRFSNSSTITTAPSSLASACCFAVQDTVSEVYWNIYTTLTTYSVVNLTSITTFVTPYPNKTVSNIETNIYTTNASFLFVNNIGRNPVTLYSNPGGGPAQTSTSLNGTQTITAGVTVASPAAFWVYSTLKIITVPQVTNSNGDYVCATVSTSTSILTGTSISRFSSPTSTQTVTRTVTETLYTSIGSGYISATGTVTRTETSYYTYYGYSISSGAAFTSTEPDVYSFTVNSYANAYFGGSATTKPSGTVLTLATPYIYLPARGSAGSNGSNPSSCNRGPGQENFGYPVQAAIDFAASQYPQIASCLPGGPSVLPATVCSAVRVVISLHQQ
ncbi:hypothetical protein BGZ60DRAFT_244159 [Tricladium varicosporioides]|nr:hypothetical protein BGZ60DRAFT_244159 [Hymenoscyphus varicosporioides]